MRKLLQTGVFAVALGLMMATFATPADAWTWRDRNSSDAMTKKDLEKMLKEGTAQVPLPGIVNWTERGAVKWLYELRDDPDFITHTYLFVPMTGKFVKICDSVGYGINASIQMANPERVVSDRTSAYGTLPQAEPNGLFMPEGLAATYVMCRNPETDGIDAIYVEPEVVVSPFALPDRLVIQ